MIVNGPFFWGSLVLFSLQLGCGLRTVRYFLPAGTSEPTGYGLYSYVLFAHPPSDQEMPAYRAIVKAYLQMLAEGPTTPAQPELLNATFLPVKRRMRPQLSQLGTKRSSNMPSDEQLEHLIRETYDYDRAGEFLDKLKHVHTGGPYIVSNRTALSLATGLQETYLDQDITACGSSPEFAGAWVRLFERSAAEQNWSSKKLSVFTMDLIAIISKAGEQVSIAEPAIQRAIKLVTSFVR